MDEIMFMENAINNPDSPFTEIFSLLMLNGNFESKYTDDDLRSICIHSENALEAILRGMQDMRGENRRNFNYFVSILCNLCESINTLKSNASYLMRQKGIVEY